VSDTWTRLQGTRKDRRPAGTNRSDSTSNKVAALFAASCGGSGVSGPAEKTTEVTMAKSYHFDPERIEIQAGQNVTWTNDDNFTHTVRVEGQEDHKVERGESVSITFDKPGTYRYVCTLHPMDMEGEVIVK
jgi:plastocyanin